MFKKILALVLVLAALFVSSGFATPLDTVEALTESILDNIQNNFFAAPVSDMWKRHYTASGVYTEAEWEQACAAAIGQAKLMGIWDSSWEDDPTTLRKDLGDYSLPVYALSGMVLLAAAGLMIAHKKRLSYC